MQNSGKCTVMIRNPVVGVVSFGWHGYDTSADGY